MIQRPDTNTRKAAVDRVPGAERARGLRAGPQPLDALLEAVLFASGEPLAARRLADALGEDLAAVREALGRLQQVYAGERGVHLVELAGGYRLLTNPACEEAVFAVAGRRARDRLSPAALETLAIVAYKQPITRAGIERIRGVGVGPILRHLLELELIRVAGREEGLGRALLYATTREFLDRFGLASLRDLPASLES